MKLKELVKWKLESEVYVSMPKVSSYIFSCRTFASAAAHGSFPGLYPVQTIDTPIRLAAALTVKEDHL